MELSISWAFQVAPTLQSLCLLPRQASWWNEAVLFLQRRHGGPLPWNHSVPLLHLSDLGTCRESIYRNGCRVRLQSGLRIWQFPGPYLLHRKLCFLRDELGSCEIHRAFRISVARVLATPQ